MTQLIRIETTTKSNAEMRTIIADLLEQGLIAGCQLSNVESMYWWKGEVAGHPECLAVMYTRAELEPTVRAAILEQHPYETPQITAFLVDATTEAYAKWAKEVTGGA